MNKSKKFENLPRPVRVVLGILGAADLALRVYALVDVAQRDERDLNGAKAAWVPALAVTNSLGLLPLAYLKWGRKP